MIPEPLNLTPFHPGHYRSIACPVTGCRWHTHFTDPAEGDAKYRAHYETVHGS